MNKNDIIRTLELKPHPEGGYYRRTYVNKPDADRRGLASSIYFLIENGPQTLWHTTDGDEIWYWHAGSPIELYTAQCEDGPVSTTRLGMDMAAGERPQYCVPANVWQSARCFGDWALVSCMVSPEFLFEGAVFKATGWHPGTGTP